jgi:UDP-glucuronate 4-epimerase
MRVLVTGCAGFVGSHLIEALLADGASVVGVDCFNDNYGRRTKLKNLERARDWEKFDFVPIDLSRGDLDDLVSDVEAVFHLAAEPGVRGSWGTRFETYLRNNVMATHHVLEALRRFPGKRLVYASSSSVYGQAETYPTSEDALPRPFSPYGVTKLDAENMCRLYARNFGLSAVCLRYFSVYGPRQRPDMAFTRFCEAAIKGAPIEVYGDGRQTRDFTYVGDIVALTKAAAATEVESGLVFNAGGGSRASLADALEILSSLAGRGLEVRYADRLAGDVRDTGADISRARGAFGYRPSVPLTTGLAEQFSWAVGEHAPERLAAVGDELVV